MGRSKEIMGEVIRSTAGRDRCWGGMDPWGGREMEEGHLDPGGKKIYRLIGIRNLDGVRTMAQRGSTTMKKPGGQKEIENPIYIRRAMERHHAAIGRLLNEKQVGSIKEANAYLQQFMGPGLDIPPVERELTPLEKAQEVMYDAWLERDRKKRIASAEKALALSPDCADAYVLLAEQTARNSREAKKLYEKGVEAGERALGQEIFIEEAGNFWGLLESRPYMRARYGLAQALWALADRKAAIAHYQELLRLNPNDNQGVRYDLLIALLTEGMDRDCETLLAEYKGEVSAAWLYSLALLTFKQLGACPKANRKLKAALKANPFVPLYMLGIKKVPRKLPPHIGIGDDSEALHYLIGAAKHWNEIPGAVEWLIETTAKNKFLGREGRS